MNKIAPRKILFATHNSAKVRRFQTKIKNPNFEIVSPADLDLPKINPQENGADEFKNAEIKARAYFQLSKLPSLSLDTGFYIDGLAANEQPGKWVQRTAGVNEGDSDELRFKKMTDFYAEIANRFGGQVQTYFKDVFCLFDGQKVWFSEGRRPTILTNKVHRKDVQFPIASMNKISAFDKYYHDLNSAEMDFYVRPSLQAIENLLIKFAQNFDHMTRADY